MATPGQIGATLTVIIAFWRSGARPLPEADSQLAALARCRLASWHVFRDVVKEALSTLIPEYRALYMAAHSSAERARAGRIKGGKASFAIMLAKRKAGGDAGGLNAPNVRTLPADPPGSYPLNPKAYRPPADPTPGPRPPQGQIGPIPALIMPEAPQTTSRLATRWPKPGKRNPLAALDRATGPFRPAGFSRVLAETPGKARALASFRNVKGPIVAQ